MKRQSEDEIIKNNLVMFPAAKNFIVDKNLGLLGGRNNIGPDPFNDLLNEFAHLKDEDIPNHLDDRFEADYSGPIYYGLDAFMERFNPSLEEQSKISIINQKILAINELQDRIKFYLDEIEMFLPSSKK